jgi:hydrogenase-4 membrane subunit HyfE
MEKRSLSVPLIISVIGIIMLGVFMFGWVAILALGGGAKHWYEYAPLVAGLFSVILCLVLPVLYKTNISSTILNGAYAIPIVLIPLSIAAVFFFAGLSAG